MMGQVLRGTAARRWGSAGTRLIVFVAFLVSTAWASIEQVHLSLAVRISDAHARLCMPAHRSVLERAGNIEWKMDVYGTLRDTSTCDKANPKPPVAVAPQSTDSSMLVEFVASTDEAYTVAFSTDALLNSPHIVRASSAWAPARLLNEWSRDTPRGSPSHALVPPRRRFPMWSIKCRTWAISTARRCPGCGPTPSTTTVGPRHPRNRSLLLRDGLGLGKSWLWATDEFCGWCVLTHPCALPRRHRRAQRQRPRRTLLLRRRPAAARRLRRGLLRRLWL